MVENGRISAQRVEENEDNRIENNEFISVLISVNLILVFRRMSKFRRIHFIKIYALNLDGLDGWIIFIIP